FSDSQFQGQYINNVRNGSGKLVMANGESFDGTFVNGTYSYGTYTFSNRDKCQGPFANGKMNGNGTCTFSNGDKYQGPLMNGKMNGNGTYICSNSDRSTAVFFTLSLHDALPI